MPIRVYKLVRSSNVTFNKDRRLSEPEAPIISTPPKTNLKEGYSDSADAINSSSKIISEIEELDSKTYKLYKPRGIGDASDSSSDNNDI